MHGQYRKYDLSLAAQKIYDFSWSELCDWYIEMAKPRLYGEDEDVKVSDDQRSCVCAGKYAEAFASFMPFITEEIYTSLPGAAETIMLGPWPKPGIRRRQEAKRI